MKSSTTTLVIVLVSGTVGWLLGHRQSSAPVVGSGLRRACPICALCPFTQCLTYTWAPTKEKEAPPAPRQAPLYQGIRVVEACVFVRVRLDKMHAVHSACAKPAWGVRAPPSCTDARPHGFPRHAFATCNGTCHTLPARIRHCAADLASTYIYHRYIFFSQANHPVSAVRGGDCTACKCPNCPQCPLPPPPPPPCNSITWDHVWKPSPLVYDHARPIFGFYVLVLFCSFFFCLSQTMHDKRQVVSTRARQHEERESPAPSCTTIPWCVLPST